jgi:hypothetical protein
MRKAKKIIIKRIIVASLCVYSASISAQETLPIIISPTLHCLAKLAIIKQRAIPDSAFNFHELSASQIAGYFVKIIAPYQNQLELQRMASAAGAYAATQTNNDLIMQAQGCINSVATYYETR